MISLNESDNLNIVCRKLKRGDKRDDGFVFNKYIKKKNRDGSEVIREVWLSPAAWERELTNGAIRCREYRLKNKDNPEYRARKRASDERFRNTESAKIKQSAYLKDYYTNPINVERRKKYKREYIDPSKNPLNRFKHNIRSLIAISIKSKGFFKNTKTEKILGCSWSFFKAYIEARFQEGQGWHNRELWDIDHIKPMRSAKTKKEAIALNHYSNLRPLWKIDNIAKKDKLRERQLELI